LNAQMITLPVLLGGAALTREYAEEDLANLYKGPLLYCKDAFEGLHAMDKISSGQTQTAVDEQRQRTEKRRHQRETAVKPKSADAANVQPVPHDNPVPTPPFWDSRVATDISPRHIFPYINEI